MRISMVMTALAVFASVASPSAHAGASGRYVSAGVVVARAGGQTPVDNGAVVCDDGNGAGVGGVCLPFGGGDAIGIIDEVAGEDVAFQVCIDNSGDGFCTTNDPDPACPDEIWFSHDDDGHFYNPLGPVATGFRPGCTGGSWDGYVVFLCEGAHDAEAEGPHVHGATTGVATVTSGGEGHGTFCGLPVVSKPYYGTHSDGNLGCGMVAISDDTVTGGQDTFAGTMVGGPWHDTGAVTLACSLVVNGIMVDDTPANTGTGATATSGQVVFVASSTDTVQIVTEVTTAAGTRTFLTSVAQVTNGSIKRYVAPQPVF